MEFLLIRIYPVESEIKDTTYTDRSASNLILHLKFESDVLLRTKYYDKLFPLWTFHLHIATFQQHLHMEYIYLSRYDIPDPVIFIMISLRELLTRKLLNQGFLVIKCKSVLRTCYRRHHELLTFTEYQMNIICSVCLNPILSSFITYQQVCNTTCH